MPSTAVRVIFFTLLAALVITLLPVSKIGLRVVETALWRDWEQHLRAQPRFTFTFQEYASTRFWAISLASAQQRRDYLNASCLGEKVPIEFINAVDGRHELPEAEARQYVSGVHLQLSRAGPRAHIVRAGEGMSASLPVVKVVISELSNIAKRLEIINL